MLNKVLFIDDDNVALMLNGKLVEKANFAKETLTALNGKLALDYYSDLLESQGDTDYPQLVFLDLNMPIMDGWDFLKEFSNTFYPHFSGTKIIVLSSSINPEDLQKSKTFPMVIDFIPKPVSIEILNRLKNEFAGS